MSVLARLERRRSRLWIGWTIVAALLLASWRLQKTAAASARQRGLAERLLGPVAMLAASVEWVRADLALRAGDYPRAYSRAETALELEPSRADAWMFLAHHFIFERASLSREVDPAERRAWVETGLEVLDRGRRVSSDPDEILFYRGSVYDYLAAIPDADRPWKGSAGEALLEAARSFDEAAALGNERAHEFAVIARRYAAEGR